MVREREEVVRGDPVEEMVGRKEETGDCGERGIALDERETALKHECLPAWLSTWKQVHGECVTN